MTRRLTCPSLADVERPLPCAGAEAAFKAGVPDKNTPVGVHCYTGGWAEEARQVLIGWGYTNVRNLGGWPQDKDSIQVMFRRPETVV